MTSDLDVEEQAYMLGYKAGQKAVLDRWPTEKDINEFQNETQIYDAEEVIQWLQSKLKEGE